MESWSISDLVDEEDDWSISDIVEANEKRYVRERDSFMKRKLPLANLSVAESEALRVIVCGLYPEGEIESAQDIERFTVLFIYIYSPPIDLQTFDFFFFLCFIL